MSFYIDQHELAELTGKVRRDAQVKWLTEHGFKAHVRADGALLVKRDDYEEYQDGRKEQRQAEGQGAGPDFSSLR